MHERFKKPHDIQLFLNSAAYNPKDECRSPAKVYATNKAHCFEGALFAYAALKEMGYKPYLVDLQADNDDDHVLCVFRQGKYWGAIAKSNTTVLRFREPVYLSVRELVMSYFDVYFNTEGYKTLRKYSSPFNLEEFKGWMDSEEDIGYLGDELEKAKHFDILDRKMIRDLSLADPDLMEAGFLGSVQDGLFKAKKDFNY